jgi:DNA-binding CsgD family transcriptional regulator
MGNSTVDDFIEQANQTLSTEHLSRLFLDAIGDLGFDRFCYSLFTDHPSLGVNAGHALAGNYPEGWMAHYLANRYDQKDPVLCHGGAMSGPFTWDWLCRTRELTAEQKKVMGEAEDAGLRGGAAVPIFGHGGELAGLGVASSLGGVKIDRVVLSKLRVLAIEFHHVYAELEGEGGAALDATAAQIHLTGREKEILLWVAAGKSDFVIADILGVSHSAVRFHMGNIFRKLNANERTLAAVKAIRQGLILTTSMG